MKYGEFFALIQCQQMVVRSEFLEGIIFSFSAARL